MSQFRHRDEFYYSRKPTDAAPCTALIVPFTTQAEARQHLINDVKQSEDDLPTAGSYGPYQVLQVIATVQPIINHNVKLKTV